MPFKPEDKIQFWYIYLHENGNLARLKGHQPIDLLYGLDGTIAATKTYLEQYTNTTDLGNQYYSFGYFDNNSFDLSRQQVGAKVVNNLAPGQAPVDPAFNGYFFQRPGYAPPQIDTSNPAMQARLNKTVDDIAKVTLAQQVTAMMTRRLSKGLMHFAVQTMGRKVFYLLDGIDIQKVLDKDMFADNVGQVQRVPICTSELRELFRRWFLFHTSVEFIEKNKRAPAPWDDPSYTDGWSAYARHRALKLGKYAKAAQGGAFLAAQEPIMKWAASVIKAHDKGDFATAISLYHGANWEIVYGQVEGKLP